MIPILNMWVSEIKLSISTFILAEESLSGTNKSHFFHGLQWSWIKVAINCRIGSKWKATPFKAVLGHFHKFIKMVYFGWMLLHEYILWESRVWWRYLLGECGGWTFFIGVWGWLKMYFGWLGLGGHFLLVTGDEWG